MNVNQEYALQDALYHLFQLEQRASSIRQIHQDLLNHCLEIIGEQKNRGFIFMLKNKFGLSKEAAKKLFYDHRKKKQDDTDPNQSPQKEPESVDEKIEMLMGYMRETTSKLDRIEDDISNLKEKVEEILKRI